MNFPRQKKQINTKRGFTLVETLVAITILILVILGPMTIASQGMQQAYFANEQTTAVFLAQESIEAVKKLRDDNALDYINYINTCSINPCTGKTSWDWMNKNDTLYYLPLSCRTGSGCDYDASNQGFIDCGSSNCLIKQSNDESATVVFGHEIVGSNTIYTRTISVTSPLDGTNAVLVTVTVSWSAHAFKDVTKSVVLQTWLYDQYNIIP